jgi:hypothetical protein
LLQTGSDTVVWAFDHWVYTMDIGKTGKERHIAQALKKRWTLSDREWNVIEELVRVLEVT